ncbi:hypothetical protein L7F22_006741 [Adiantum nelumboides]|nr:hypothetical protein [Adiantum nelumboides]
MQVTLPGRLTVRLLPSSLCSASCPTTTPTNSPKPDQAGTDKPSRTPSRRSGAPQRRQSEQQKQQRRRKRQEPDLVTKLGPQIGFLVHARPLGASVVMRFRYLKYEISVTPVELNEERQRSGSCRGIDHFVRDRITYATRVIAHNVATGKIKDGDVVLTFARSSVVQQTILEAWERGKRFKRHHCRCTAALRRSQATLVTRFSRDPLHVWLVDVAQLARLASNARHPWNCVPARQRSAILARRHGTLCHDGQEQGCAVIVCCETYKFSERVQLDGFVINEAGNPTDILAKEDGLHGETLSKLITPPPSGRHRADWAQSICCTISPRPATSQPWPVKWA